MPGKRYTIPLLVLTGLLVVNALYGQDPRLSQFYAAPLQWNPAMIGVYPGKVRFAATYRELYASILKDQPFRTLATSFDTRFRTAHRDYIGLGFTLMRDQVGLSRYASTQGNVGLSFMKQLNGGSRYATNDQYLVAGAQVGFGQRSFDWQQLWFSNQFDTQGGFINFDAPNGEAFEEGGTSFYLDFNAGLLWYALFDENASFYVGGALHHINSPNIAFLGGEEDRLYRRWVAHTGGELPISNELSILPGVIFMTQGPSMSSTAGANFRYTHREWKELALRAGGWVHLNNGPDQGFGLDAVIFTAVLELERWNLGFSYDVTSSSLSEANNSRGALEISLTYFHPEKSRYRVNCPKL